MVLKEDLCAWFRDLQPRKRIDYMCGLLDMCLPLELRFIGTVLEDIAKKDFNYLRDAESKANSLANIESMNECDSERLRGKTVGLSNEIFRARMHINLALMHSNNTACASAIFSLLEKQFDFILHFLDLHSKELLEEICSILTLACHHPAFQFYHRSRLGGVLKTVESRTQHLMEDTETHLNLPPSNSRDAYRPMAFCNRPPIFEHHDRVRIRLIQVKGLKARDEQQNKKGPLVYDVHTTWSTGEITQVFMKYKEFQDIHQKLVNKFPDWQPYGASLPDFPSLRKYRDEHKEGVSNLSGYLSELLKAPAYILDSDILTHPLRNGKAVQPVAMGTPGTIQSPSYYRIPLIPGGTQYYEYKISQDAFRMTPYTTYPYPSMTLAATSPRTSHISSSTTSPTNSRPSSPVSSSKSNANHSKSNNRGNDSQPNPASEDTAPVGEPVLQLLHLCDLEKYSDNLSCYTFEQLLNMSKEDLGKAGLPADAQVKLRSKLDHLKHNPQTGQIEIPGYPSSASDQGVPVHQSPVWPVHPSQEAPMVNCGPPPSSSQMPYHPVSALASPQTHNAMGESSPANSEVCSPSLSPALLPSDSPQNSPIPSVVRGSNVALPLSATMSLKSGRALQIDSSGSEDDRVSGVDMTEIVVANQGFGRPQLSNSLPLISQTSGPPGFIEKKVNVMPHMHMPTVDSTVESNTPPGLVPTTSATSVSMMNGYMSDSTSFMPPNASSVIPTRMLNTRAFKHAQPTHTALGRHQNVVNMPVPDLSSQPVLHTMNKNGNGLNALFPSGHPHQFMMPPPQGNAVPGHPTLQAAANSGAPNPSGGQPSIQSLTGGGETGNIIPFLFLPHPNVPPQRGILNTMANSTVVITTSQSHPTAPPPLPTSHSPSPVASVIASDQMAPGGYVSSNSEVLAEARQEGSPTSPPNHNVALGSAKAGPNSGTPSPPLANKQTTGNVNCDSAAPSVFIPHPFMIPIHGHSNGLVTPMPPHFPFPHTSNPAFPNGLTHEMYLHRYPAQLGGGQLPLHLYGNSIYPLQMHTANNNNGHSNSGNNNGGSNGNNSKSGCYNCGHAGHKAVDCKESNMDSMTKPFALNINPTTSPKADPE